MIHKTESTIASSAKWVDDELTDRLRYIAASIPAEARDILDRGREETIYGEMILYDMLVDAGTRPIPAAQAAVAVPDSLYFHPGKPGLNGTTLLQLRLQRGQDPLTALVETVSSLGQFSVSSPEYEIRVARFRSVTKSLLN